MGTQELNIRTQGVFSEHMTEPVLRAQVFISQFSCAFPLQDAYPLGWTSLEWAQPWVFLSRELKKAVEYYYVVLSTLDK